MSLKNDFRIWYVSKYAISPEYGGATRQYFLSKYFVRQGYDTTLISSRSAALTSKTSFKTFYKKMTKEGVNCVMLNGPTISYGFSFKRIISWFIFEINLLFFSFINRKKKPNVLIVSSLSLLTFISGIILKKFFKCKLIVEVRDIWPLTLIELSSLSKYNLIIKFLSKIEYLGYKHADLIVGSMPNLKEHVENVSAFQSKVRCIPMGYDPDYYKISEPPLFPLAGNKLILGYAGAIGKSNCVNEILEAADLLRDLPVEFRVLGDGPDKAKLLDFKNNKNLKNVKFYDKIPKDKVPEFLNSCHILINLWNKKKIYQYGVSPNKWIDYMLSSRPIILALEGYVEPFKNINCGWVIPPNDPYSLSLIIKEIYTIPMNELKAIGEKGYKYVIQNLDYNKIAQDYLLFIKNV